MHRTLRFALLLATLNSAACNERPPKSTTVVRPAVDSVRCAALRPADTITTSRAGFLQEVLDARPTARTPRFNDYHAGSYHVGKPDLAAGLQDVARACGLSLRGVVVLGPIGPLWAYHVAAFLDDSSGPVRVNALAMPHARITWKATGTVSAASADSVLGALAASPLLVAGDAPAAQAPARDTGALAREFGYDVLVLRQGRESVEVRSGSLREAADTAAAARLLDRVNALLARLRQTYPDSSDPRRDR